MKVKPEQIINDFLTYARHKPAVIHMENPETDGE